MKSKRRRYLNKSDVKNALKNRDIEFVIADVGFKLLWIDKSYCFSFWKNEVKEHLIESPENINLLTLPNEYGYLGSEWEVENKDFVILLEKID